MNETITSSTQIFNESDSILPPLPNVDLESSKDNLRLSSVAATSETNMAQNHNSLLNQECIMEEEIPDDFLYGYLAKQQDTWQETPVVVPNISFESPTPPTASPTIPPQQIQKELAEQLHQLKQLNQVQSLLKEIPAKQAQKAPRKKVNIGEKLSPMLNDVGGITSIDAVIPFLQLMAKSSSDTHKIFLTVILATKEPLTLQKIIESEGLSLFNTLLTQAKNQSNISHMRLLLKALQHLPVTLKALRATEIGKNVNKLKKESDPEVVSRSTEIVKQWMQLLETDTKKAKPTVDKKKVAEKKKEPVLPKKQVLNSTNDDFDSQLSAAKKTLPQKHKVQLLEDPSVIKKPSVVSPKQTNVKPISADDIKKAKMKEKLENPEEKEPPTKKIRTLIPPSSQQVQPLTSPTSTPTLLPSKKVLPTETDAFDPISNLKSVPEEEFEPETLIPGISKKTGKPKKRVSWPSQEKLEAVKLFTKEEGEHQHHNFQIAKQLEHQKERERLNPLWKIPPTLEIPLDHMIRRGAESKQIAIQQRRELTELQAHYIDDKSIPDTPAEPSIKEPDYDDSKTPLIPFEESASQPSITAAPEENIDLLSSLLGNQPSNLLENLSAMLGGVPNLSAVLQSMTPTPPPTTQNVMSYTPTPYVQLPQFAPPQQPTGAQNFAMNFGQLPNSQNFGITQNFPPQQRNFPPQNYTAQNFPPRDNFSAPQSFPRDNFAPPQRDAFPPSSQNFPSAPRDSYRDNNFSRDNSRGEFVSRDTFVPSRDTSNYVAPPSTANLRTAAGSTAGLTRDEIEKKLCHFFTTAKGCRNAANCNFFHDLNARYDPNTNSMKLPR